MTLTIATFIFFTALVALATWWVTRGGDREVTDEGYFLAGRSLSGVFIAGSLLLTNLSTEQLIGLNGRAFVEGLSVMAWEVIAGMSLVALALYFLPRYLRSGIATIPQFFEERYGSGVRAVTTLVFVIAYMLILLPFVLFAGAKGLSGMLGLEELLGLGELQTIWVVVVFIALVGSAYAIWGGLKAVAVSDTFNGAGLLIGGLMLTYFALAAVAGEGGSVFSAFSIIADHDPDAFRSLGTMDEEVSWPTLFTGVLLLNFFYWSTNQQIIQRTFAAKNLAEGQKGVLLAAFFKILAPLILVVPGIAAAYLAANDDAFAEKASGGDAAYGALVATVLPKPLIGFFAAVVVGSILSTFNSVLNSSATLFSLDVYKNFLRRNASTKEVVRSGQLCSLVVAVFAVIAAPTVFYQREGIFDFFQKLNGVYFIPVLAIMIVGLANRTADSLSALITLIVGLGAMSLGTFLSGAGETVNADGVAEKVPGWVNEFFGSGFHFMGAVFVSLILLQLALDKIGLRRSEPYQQADAGAVDLTPWKPAPLVGAVLVALALVVYFAFAF